MPIFYGSSLTLCVCVLCRPLERRDYDKPLSAEQQEEERVHKDNQSFSHRWASILDKCIVKKKRKGFIKTTSHLAIGGHRILTGASLKRRGKGS